MTSSQPPGPPVGRDHGHPPENNRELVSLLQGIQKTVRSLTDRLEGELKASLSPTNKDIKRALQLAQPVSLSEINTKLDRILKTQAKSTPPVTYASAAAQGLPLMARGAYTPAKPLSPPRHFPAIFRAAESSPL